VGGGSEKNNDVHGDDIVGLRNKASLQNNLIIQFGCLFAHFHQLIKINIVIQYLFSKFTPNHYVL
jgi:hypothetical protein